MLNTQFFIFMTLGLLLYLYYDARQFDDASFVMVDFIVYHVPVGIFVVIIAAIFPLSVQHSRWRQPLHRPLRNPRADDRATELRVALLTWACV